jgi:hypothetical protein
MEKYRVVPRQIIKPREAVSMNQEEFTNISNEMVESIVGQMQRIVYYYSEKHGTDKAMDCFASALAIASGNLISQVCFGLKDPKMRSGMLKSFFQLCNESAENHRKRTVAKMN